MLDFYVHESTQRSGCGKKLFEAMIEASILSLVAIGTVVLFTLFWFCMCVQCNYYYLLLLHTMSLF